MGTACDTIKNDMNVSLSAHFPCGVVVPIVIPK
jgi:hypothetical protein